MNKVSPEFIKQVAGYGLSTSEIVYRMPDHLHILQTYIWQDYDIFPQFPVLKEFLNFWDTQLEGPIYAEPPGMNLGLGSFPVLLTGVSLIYAGLLFSFS
jgi:uncharacterized protein Usg